MFHRRLLKLKLLVDILDHGIVRNILGDDSAGGYHHMLSYRYAWENSAVGTDAGVFFDVHGLAVEMLIFGDGVSVIAKYRIRPDEDIVLNHGTVIEFYPVLDGAVIADDHVVLDEDMRADIAVCSYDGFRQYHTELPNVGVFADVLRLNVR